MFRYIALAWDDAIPTDTATAKRLGLELQARADWQTVLRRPGLHVFAAGAKQGVNGACPLLTDQGVVLGKLFRQRDLDHPPTQDLSLTADDAGRILQDGGRSLISDYWGRYVAFMHTQSGGTLLLRDPSGTLPCFLMRHRDVWIAFSWLEDVLTLMPDVPPPSVNWECVAAHVLLGELGGHETALVGVTQVLPGEVVDLGRDGETRTLLWNAVDIARSAAGEDLTEAAGMLRETVGACARSWASCYDGVLFRLSGGVDSSILLSCLAKGSTAARVTCVNYHSPGADSDERPYARLAAARAQRELIERERDSSFRLERVLDVARTPTPSSYVGRMGTARMDAELAAAHGAAALFTGGGGDQLFFEFRRWWPAADYLRSRGLDAGFAAAAMDAARLGSVSVWKAIGLAVADRLHPAPPPEETGKHLTLLRHAALPKAKHHDRFTHPALLRVNALPIGKRTQTRELMHPTAYYDPFELDAAPELVNPLLSQPLVELCLRLPTYVLANGGRGRALARQAFAADLPSEITTRRSKGGMEEHIKAVLLRNLDFARAMLLDGELVARGILDRAKVEEALSGRPTALASRIGEIHFYIGIEVWIKRWSARSRRTAAQ